MAFDMKVYMKKYRDHNRDYLKRQHKVYREINNAKIKDYQKKYKDDNKHILKEYNKEYSREYRETHKEYIKIYQKKYRNDNRKELNFKRRAKHLKNPQFRISCLVRSRLWEVLNDYAYGKKFKSNKYGVDYNAIIEHLKPFPKDISKFHVDHIKPLCSFDLTDPKQIKIAFDPENHQWLTIEQNLRKGKKEVELRIARIE